MREVCQQSIIVQIVYGVTDVQLQQWTFKALEKVFWSDKW